MFTSKITGTGSYLPEKILSNADLEKLVDTSNEWIIERTGIKERHIASPQENTTDLAYNASVQALKSAGIQASDLDLILFATTSPDRLMPSAACVLQEKLGAAAQCGALDLAAACSGFIYGYSIADQLIKAGAYKNILVVGAELLSRVTDYTDRGTCILFGDGAGAAIISRSDSDSKVHSHKLYANGSWQELIAIEGGGSRSPISQKAVDEKMGLITMEGREVFKRATRVMVQCSEDVLSQAEMGIDDVDWLVPHQANLRIIEAVAKKFEVNMDKVIVEIEKMGNCSAATIPICMDRAIRDGRITRGQNILLTAFGGGITSGSLLLRY